MCDFFSQKMQIEMMLLRHDDISRHEVFYYIKANVVALTLFTFVQITRLNNQLVGGK